MSHLAHKYTKEYFLGGFDPNANQNYGLIGYKDFNKHRINERYLQFISFTKSVVGPLENKDILEIGFGRGELISLFLQEEVKSYLGIDCSKAAVEIASDKIKSSKVDLLQCDAKDFNNSKTFDIIVLNDVIEYIPVFEMEVVWKKIKNSLRPGGYIIIRTPLYENPNMPDQLDNIHQTMGLSCNKQTFPTLVKSCIEQQFICAYHNEDCYGFVNKSDIPMYNSTQQQSFKIHHKTWISKLNIESNKEYTNDDLRRLIPGAGRFVIGCVTENIPKYKEQTLRLVHSIRSFAENSAGVNMFVCIVDNADPDFVEHLQDCGVFVRIVKRFSHRHPPSNKLRFLELQELHSYDTIMLLDCDTIIVQDPYPSIDGEHFQAKIVNQGSVPHSLFQSVFHHYQLPLPKQEYKTTLTNKSIIWYCNAGVLIFPQPLLQSFYPIWRNYTVDLIKTPYLLGNSYYFCEQISLALAYQKLKVPYKELPSHMNSPIFKPRTKTAIYDPIIIHYMKRGVTKDGYIRQKSKDKNIAKKIQAFNRKWKDIRTLYKLDDLFKS